MKILAILLLLVASAFSQDVPNWEVSGGYSYLNVDGKGSPRVSTNGWQASFVENLTKHWSGEFDFSRYYRTTSGSSSTVNVYVGGPRVNFRPAFLHALIGAVSSSTSEIGNFSRTSTANSGFGLAGGGGFEWSPAPHFALRPSADYLFTHVGIAQHNIRVGIAFVYTFGTVGPEVAAIRPSTDIPTLGIRAVEHDGNGAEIVAVESMGPAERATLRVGDVITLIDDKPINSPAELSAALANRPAHSEVKVGYLLHSVALGYFGKETTATLR